MRFGKSDKIQFISTVEGLESIEECLPKPAKQFIPKWFKDMPAMIGDAATVKNCPSFPDYFSQGYIVPMWIDVLLQYNKKTDTWNWDSSFDVAEWAVHDNRQFVNSTVPSFNGIESQVVFKAICPWMIVTPPGWSVLQLPLFYHFNKEWSVMPGVIDTDIHHEINQQVLYHGDGKEIKIKSGEPFVLYIPFKRSNKLKNEIKYQTKKEKKIFEKNTLDLRKRFSPNGHYRKLQRDRDKNV